MSKKFSKAISIITATLMLLTVFVFPVSTVQANTDYVDSNDIKWTVGITNGVVYFDEATGTITGCDTDVTKAIIPSKINGVNVTSIGYDAFSECSSLTSITIPNSVTSIGDRAFYGCSSLTSITIPNGVTSIEYNAFYGCSSLTSITIPNSVTSIGYSAFYGCSSLTSITIPNGVTSIEEEAFSNCSSLTSITIPNSVTSIERNAFLGCSSLISITIPNSVISIDDFAFYGCSSLTSITIPSSVTNMGSFVFEGCKAVTIYGAAGSYAEIYADEYNIPFIAFEEDAREFELGKDSNSFTHNNGIGDGFEGISNTKLSKSFYNKLVANASKAEKEEILKMIDKSWGGSCHGISYTMALTYTGDLDLSNVKENTNYYDMPRPCENDYFLDTINYYQLMQYLKSYDNCTVSTCYGGVFSGLANLLYGGDDLETFLKKFVSQVENDEVVPFSFGVGLSGHTILALDCEKCKDDSYKIKLYNMNNNSSFMEMIIEEDYSDFYYKDNVLGTVKKSTFKYISFDDIDLLSEVGITSPLNENSLNTYRLRNNNEASIIFDADESFTITVDGEDKITFDQEGYESDVSISNISPIVTGNELKYRMDFSTEESIKIENIDEDFEIDFLAEEEFYSAAVNNAEEITITKNEGIVLDGDNYSFETYSSANAEDSELIKFTAETSGKTTITSEQNGVEVVSENPLNNTAGFSLSDSDTVELKVADGQTSLNFPVVNQEKGWKEISGKWYYFNDYKVTTGWAKINKKWYYFNDKGIMQTGLKKIDGKKYYLSDSGAMKTGWQQIDGIWYYFNSSGAAAKGWLKLSKKWYYFNEENEMLIGLQTIKGEKYYFLSSGAMKTGWQKINGTWYYFKSSGAAAEGWQKLSKKWYYFNEENEMFTGLQTIKGEQYYFLSGGAMKTGWQKINSDWYYFKSSGVAAEGWLQTAGQMTSKKSDDKWYFFDEEYKMVTGEYTIKGVVNKFDSSGLWLGVK